MEDDGIKIRKTVSKEVQAVRDLCDALSKCLNKRLNMAQDRYKPRIKMILDHVNIYRSFLERTKDRLQGCHFRWYIAQIYDVYYDRIPSIIDETNHGDPKADFMMDNELVLWVGKGTPKQKENYRLAIGITYNYAIQALNRCIKNYEGDEEIDYKLQLDYLISWEIKYHLMNVLCYALEDRNSDDPDLKEMRDITAKLKFLANLTEEQAKKQAKESMTGFVGAATNMVKSLGIKDKDGNVVGGDMGNMDGLSDVIGSLMSQDVGTAISEALSGDVKGGDPFDIVVDRIVPVVKRSMKKIPRPDGVNDNKEDEPKDLIDTLCSEKGKKNIKKGIASLQKAFTDAESDETGSSESEESK